MPPALRSLMSVIVGVFAINIVFSLLSTLSKTVTQDDLSGRFVLGLVIRLGAAAVGGFVCGIVAGRKPLLHGAVLAILYLGFSVAAFPPASRPLPRVVLVVGDDRHPHRHLCRRGVRFSGTPPCAMTSKSALAESNLPVTTAAIETRETTHAPVKTARKPALPALTGMRTFLAVNIMFFHFTPPHIEWITPIVGHGFVFVGFFLLISGFILSYNYGDRGPSLSLRDFWVARAVRLYPVYLLSLAISIPVLILEFHARSRKDFYEGFFMTPLLLQGWSPWLATFWNTVAWTLSTEAFLYAVFPFLLRIKWPDSAARLIAIALGLWAVGLIPHALYIFFNPDGLGTVDRYSYGYWLRGLKFTPLPYLCTFIVGVVLGRLKQVWALSQRQLAIMGFLAVGGLVAFLYLGADHTPYILMHGGLCTPLFGMLILGVTGRNPVAGFFGWKPFVLVGETTFCLYLLHFNVLQMMRDHHLPERLHYAALEPWSSYVLMILIAFAIYRFYENPMRKWLLGKFGRRAPHAVAKG